MLRLISPCLVLLFLPAGVLGQSSSPPACQNRPCVQVGSYNIKYLGQSDRSKDDVRDLADLIAKQLDLEVVVLQEIDTASKQWSWLKQNLTDEGYDFKEGTTSERDQYVVLAWDADEVTLTPNTSQELATDDEFTNPADTKCTYKGLRKPVAAQLKAGSFDFWVVGVHLKSRSRGRAPNKLPYGCPSWIREQQAAQLIQQANSLASASGEADVLLAGDFNELYTDDSLGPIRMAGFTSQMAYRMTGSRSGSYLPAGDDDLIDHIWINFPETQEVVRSSGFVFTPADEAAYQKKMSDHVPVWASFYTDVDLDDLQDEP